MPRSQLLAITCLGPCQQTLQLRIEFLAGRFLRVTALVEYILQASTF